MVIKALDPDPYWSPDPNSGSGSGKNEYGSTTLQYNGQFGTAGSFFPDLAAEGPAMKAFNSPSETGRRVSRRTAFPSLSSVSVPCTMGGSHQTQWFPSAVSHPHSCESGSSNVHQCGPDQGFAIRMNVKILRSIFFLFQIPIFSKL